MNVSINGRELVGVGIDLLAERLAGLASTPRLELWLRSPEGRAVCLLKTDHRAMLMFLRAEGDPGLTSRAADDPGDGDLPFLLANGQVDGYPASWTVTFEQACRALEFFWFNRSPAPFIAWHDDAG